MTSVTAQQGALRRPSHAALQAEVRSVRPDERRRLNLSWLIQLHWWAIVGQLVVVGSAPLWTAVGLPVGAILALVALESLGNLALDAWARRARITDAVVAGVMLTDAVVLTILLDLTGGASNPFSTLYLVNVALAALLLPPRWAWTLLVASLAGFGSLFLHESVSAPGHHVHMGMSPAQMLGSHLRGMWVAFALAACFIVYFVRRVAALLAERERELGEARAQAERREKLASLATLAAGAAHELSTPLSTIAVVARELQRALADHAAPEVRQDLRLVREQVARCREILNRMSANAGETAGEQLAPVTVRRWVEGALDGFPARELVSVELGDAGEATVMGPPRALGDALRGLLKNAVQASGPGEPVTVRAVLVGGRVRIAVADRGRGMPADVLARVGEPFFTTKVPGEGMGLGLFLTRALAEQLGGELRLASRSGSGTEATIELPAAGAGERSDG